MFAEQGLEGKAIEALKSAMSLDKKRLAPRANLGLVYTAAEQWRNAAHHLGRAVEMDDGLASTPVRIPPRRSSCEHSRS